MDVSERPSKQEIFLSLLGQGWVSLHLDARCSGVVVPAPFAGEPHLVLQYGRDMPIPIPDLEVTPAGVSATLSFSRIPHRTYIPWSAVYVVACTNGAGFLFREDLPADVALYDLEGAESMTERLMAEASDAGLPPAPEEPWLRSVPAEAALSDDGLAVPTPSRRRRRPQLRLVK